MEWLAAAGAAFIVIVPVELPDKTFVATLVLATRYRALPVWLGVVAAFFVQCVVAVAAGHLLSRLPERPVQIGAAALFAIGAVILFRGARRADAEEAENERKYQERIKEPLNGWQAFGASFAVLFAAEWGDLSQLLTASLVATGRPAAPVFFGSWFALATVSGAGVAVGRVLLNKVRLPVVCLVGASICAILAVVTAITALG